MERDIQNILELPKDALTLIAGYLDLFSLNRFARTCKIFNSILHYEAFWEIYYYSQPWTIFAPKKEKIPTRKPNTTWKSTFIDLKNLVFEKFSVPVRGFNWAINEGILPPKKDIWIKFLIANRGLLLDDQKIAEILFRSIKSKEGFAKIFFEEVNVDLPLDWLLRKAALMIRPIPNTTPDLALDALAYEYTRRVMKITEPEEIKSYCDKIRAALLLLLTTASNSKKPSKQEFDEKMSQYLTCPELQRGSDKFYENVIAIPTQHTRRTTYSGPLSRLTDGNQVVYCEIYDCSLSIFNDETKEILLRKFDFKEEESLAAFNLSFTQTKEAEDLVFVYKGETLVYKSLKNSNDKTAINAFLALYYNIVLPKLLPW